MNERFGDRLRAVGRPLWVSIVRDPVEEGHLRLKGMHPFVRWVAIVGIMLLSYLLVSVLFIDRWRANDLMFLDAIEDRPEFAPAGMVPVTLLAFAVAWLTMMWGALHSGAAVRIVAALGFLLINAGMGDAAAFEASDALALSLGPTVIKACYFGAPGLLVLSCLVPGGRWRRARPLFLGATAVAVIGLFAGHLWVHVAFTEAGFEAQTASLLSSVIRDLEGLLTPLVFASGLLIIDFALDVGEGTGLAGRAIAGTVAKVLLVGVIVVKLWVEFLSHIPEWVDFAALRPSAVIRTLVSLVVLVVAIRWIRSLAESNRFKRNKEALLYGSSFVLAIPTLISMLVVSFGLFMIRQVDASAYDLIRGFPSLAVSEWGRWIAAIGGIIAGFLLLRLGAPARREIGAGILLMGAWILPVQIAGAADWSWGFDYQLFDIGVTVAVGAWVAYRWRSLEAFEIVGLLAVVVFSWLVMSRGDFISFAGEWFGFPAVVVVVIGIALSAIMDSVFTGRSSARLPQSGRSLMWIGYLIMSVTILHWLNAVHTVDRSDRLIDLSYFYLGIPLAAWLAARSLLRPSEMAEAATDAN